ncbi:MAG: tetratricopeptide repeat protein, partial [Chitinispirillaceae bacterium]|nr:tetratricopeptide repeat protein [Chitinispirillaceae bacterium]
RNFTEGKSFAERAIKADPQNAEGYYELGRAYVGLGDYVNAQKVLTKGEEIQPENPLIQKLLGDVLIYQNKYEEAYHHYNRACVLRPLDLDLFLKTAAALEYSGKKKEALDLLYSITGRFPSKPELRRQIGMLEFENDKADSACKSLTMYLSIKPDDGLAWQTLGMAYVKSGNFKKAKESFEKALPLVKDKIPCQLALADLELKEKNINKAKELLTKIVSEKPIKGAHSLLGDALALENKKEEALKEYKKERELHGEDSVLQSKIAIFSYEIGIFSAAKKEFDLLIKIAPQHKTAFYYLALLSLRSGNVEEATELLNKAEKIATAPYGIYFEAGNLFRERNALDKAIKAYQRCITLKPDHEEALVNLADVYLKVGKDNEYESPSFSILKLSEIIKSYLPKSEWDNLAISYLGSPYS